MLASVSPLDWFVLILSVVAVTCAGTWFARRQKSTEQYFVGGRSVPGWAAGLSLFASSISTITFLAYPGQGFGGDWALLVPGFTLPFVIMFVALVIVPFYRRVVRMTAYEYLERRFGYPARAYAAFLYLGLNLFRFAFVLFLSAQAIHTLTGWNIIHIVLISGALVIAYTVMGGFEAVVWTDVVQSLILLAGGTLCVILLLLDANGGPLAVIRSAHEAGKFLRPEHFVLDLNRPTFIVMVLYGAFSHASGYVTTQDAVQRYLAPPSTRSARRGLWLGTLSCVITWTMFMLIGTLLYVHYRAQPGGIPEEIWTKQDRVLPYFIMTRFPAGAVGLVLAAMVAASMSTLSTVMNSMSMVTVCDFISRSGAARSERRQVALSRLLTCFWGVVGTGVALSMLRVEQALSFSYTIGAILSGGLLGVFMLAFLVRRSHAAGIYAGLAAGTLVSAWGSLGELAKLLPALAPLAQALPFHFHTYMLVVFSNVASFACGLVVCFVVPDRLKRRSTGLVLWDLRSPEPYGQDLPGAQVQRHTGA